MSGLSKAFCTPLAFHFSAGFAPTFGSSLGSIAENEDAEESEDKLALAPSLLGSLLCGSSDRLLLCSYTRPWVKEFPCGS